MNKIWVCPLCLTRNHFPHHYADISSENRPAEIIPQFTTMEYVLDATVRAPVFLFVIDTCVIEEELKQIKNSLFQSLLLLPQNAQVGLITFGRNVHIHELSFEEVRLHPNNEAAFGARNVAWLCHDHVGSLSLHSFCSPFCSARNRLFSAATRS